MIGDLTRNFNSFIMILLLCSCCKTPREQGSVLPEWEAKIPTGSSNVIYYNGLPNLPCFKDLIVAHTTLSDNGLWHEDNRLCAVSTKSGEIIWYFPAEQEKLKYCAFNADGYLFDGKIVFQYQKDARTYYSRNQHTTVCLDVENGDVLWEEDGMNILDSPNNSKVKGNENLCFFIQNKVELYCCNLFDNTIKKIYSSDFPISDFSCIDNNKLMIISSMGVGNGEDYYNRDYVDILNYDTGVTEYHREVTPASSYRSFGYAATGIYSEGIIYINIDSYISAFDIKNNTQLWEREDYWAYSLIDLFVQDEIVLKCGINATIAYNKNTGEILYDYRNYGSWHTSVDGEYAYLLNRKQNIDIIDINTGKILDTIKCKYQTNGEDFSGSYPVIYGDKMYIMSYNHLFRYPTYPWK